VNPKRETIERSAGCKIGTSFIGRNFRKAMLILKNLLQAKEINHSDFAESYPHTHI
jgi:hypothetical protein